MNCTNCGNTLEENAKFCTKCGKHVSIPNANIGQQPVYNVNPAGVIPEKNNTITIILGIAVGVLVIVLISMQSKVTNLENELSQAQLQIEDYGNRNAIDKTIDAIGSWLD